MPLRERLAPLAATIDVGAKLLERLGHSVENVNIPLLEQNDLVATAMTLFMGELLLDFRKLVASVPSQK